jgi:hypothetical protein
VYEVERIKTESMTEIERAERCFRVSVWMNLLDSVRVGEDGVYYKDVAFIIPTLTHKRDTYFNDLVLKPSIVLGITKQGRNIYYEPYTLSFLCSRLDYRVSGNQLFPVYFRTALCYFLSVHCGFKVSEICEHTGFKQRSVYDMVSKGIESFETVHKNYKLIIEKAKEEWKR